MPPTQPNNYSTSDSLLIIVLLLIVRNKGTTINRRPGLARVKPFHIALKSELCYTSYTTAMWLCTNKCKSCSHDVATLLFMHFSNTAAISKKRTWHYHLMTAEGIQRAHNAVHEIIPSPVVHSACAGTKSQITWACMMLCEARLQKPDYMRAWCSVRH